MRNEICFAVLALGVLCSHPAAGREWKDSTGSYSVEAELVAVDDGEVRLRKANGQVITVPMDRLSQADRRYLESTATEPQDAKPEPAEKARPGGDERVTGGRDAIQQALGKPVDYDFIDSPLLQTVQHLAGQHGIPWYIDQPGIQETGLPPTAAPITGKATGETLEEALNKLLGPRGFAWLVRHEVLFVTTAEQASRFLEPRVYVLTRPVPNPAGLAREFQQKVSPGSWNSVGGPGSITVGPAGSFIVSQSYPVHRQLQRQYGRLMRPVIQPDTPTTAPPSRGSSKPLEALNQAAVCQFMQTPLDDVVEALSERHHVNIVVDEEALSDVGISVDMPIIANWQGIKLQSALTLMLRGFDLVWTADDNTLLVTTPERQATMLIPNSYNIRDLAAMSRGNVDWLLQLITTHVKPASWADASGPGQISVVPANGRIEVRQTFQNHQTIQQLLRDLRQGCRR